MINKRSKWFKCDLHFHTTANLCFKDRNVTAREWVQSCLEKKLDCVTISDHNTGGGIEGIKQSLKITKTAPIPTFLF